MKILYPLCVAAAGFCAVAVFLLPSGGPVSFEHEPSRLLADASGSLGAADALLRVPVERRAPRAETDREASAAAPLADYAIVAHRAHPASDALYEATNAAQGLWVAFATWGIRVVAEGADAELSMDVRAVGHGDRMQAVTEGALYARGERIDYHRTTASGAAITEYFVNRQDGLEQSFFLEVPVDARRDGAPLVVELVCSGDYAPRMQPEGDAIGFAAAAGAPTLRYDGLYAFDASGRELPSRMELRGDHLALVVDDADAVYPVTVDPKMGGGGKGNPSSDVEVRDASTDGIISDFPDGEAAPADYIDGVDKVNAYYGWVLDMGTKGKGEPRQAQFDFGTARLLPRGSGSYEGAHGDLPPGVDPDGWLRNSVQFNTWGGLAYEPAPGGGWQRTADVDPEAMAIGVPAYMGFNVNLVKDSKNVTQWRLFFGPAGFDPFPPLDAEPVVVTRVDETTWTIEALDLGAGVRVGLVKRTPSGPHQYGHVDSYALPFKMTFTKQ